MAEQTVSNTEKKKSSLKVVEVKNAEGAVMGRTLEVTTTGGQVGKFDLGKITLPEVVRHCFEYGVKQILSDATARNKDEKLDDKGKLKVMEEKFESMIDGKILTVTREGGKDKVSKFFGDEVVEERVADMATMGMKVSAKQVITLLEKSMLVYNGEKYKR